MKGLEGMLSSMIGFTPEQLANMAKQMQDAIMSMAEAMADIKKQNTVILEKLERLENDGYNSDDSNGRGNDGIIVKRIGNG